eukprot:m51a1_g13285 hypothetical protein (127) ;mRNA; r:2062-2442
MGALDVRAVVETAVGQLRAPRGLGTQHDQRRAMAAMLLGLAIRAMGRAERQSAAREIPSLVALLVGLMGDEEQMSVRKDATTALARVYDTVGEGYMQQHLQSLDATKVKLLEIYVGKVRKEEQVAS